MSRESKFIKSTIILAFGTFLPKLASFVILPIISGYMSKLDVGQYDLVTVLESLLLPIATLQIQTAAFRFLIDKRGNEAEVRKIISNIFVFTIPISLLTLTVLFFIMKLSALTKLFICMYLFFDILANIARQIVRGLGLNHFYSVSAVLNSFTLMIGVVCTIYWLRMGLNGAVLALSIASFTSFAYLFVRAKMYKYISFSLLDKKIIASLLGYSWPMVPNSMSMWVMRLSDRFIVTGIMGLEANAVYSMANKIPHLLTLAQTTFTMAWQENASIVAKDEDVAQYYTDMYRRIYRFMAGCMGMLIAVTPILFKLLIHGDYDEAIPQLPILILAMFFSCLSAYMGGVYVAMMKTKSVGVTTIISAAINFLFNIGTIHYIGLYAASISTLVSYVFLTLFRMIDVRKFVKLKYAWLEMGLILIVLVGQCYLFLVGNLPAYLANGVIGAVLFVGLNMEIIKGLYAKAMQMLKHATQKN